MAPGLITATPEGLSDFSSDIDISSLKKTKIEASDMDRKTVQCVRGLVLDCCQQWGIGHGGSALGMAAIGTALWRHKLRFDPSCPDWFDRDRFVMSNGHVALLQYIMLHLSGYELWTMEELKAYCHPTALNFTNHCKTHPEIEFDGLDVSTGPLGQGIANAVGMAIANMNLRARFNRDDFQLIQSKVYATTGDACLQEGPALEAISLAGKMKLDNLILIYDNNGIQSDGPISLTFTENVNDKMRACGWYVMEIPDGNHNVDAIITALEHADKHVGQPVFININTTIGIGTAIAGTNKAHHAAFGHDSVKACKASWGYDPEQTHVVPDDVRQYWAEVGRKGRKARNEWESLRARYMERFPEARAAFEAVETGALDPTWKEMMMKLEPAKNKMPVRQSSGAVFDELWKKLPLMGGSADLSEPNFVLREPKQCFGPPDPAIAHQAYAGRYIHFGTREHGMAAIANGIAAYSPRSEHGDRQQAFIPVTATFSMFQLYAAPAIRMGALMSLKIIHIGTHDSIAEGACGPTHQPVELINLWRSMPNLQYIRPGDAEEAIGAWIMAIEHNGPTVLGLNRGAVPLQKGTDRVKMQKGAYVVVEEPDAQVTLIATGSELYASVDAAEVLKSRGIPARVVSMPCMGRFGQQDQAYMDSVIPRDGRPVVSVEAMSMHGWGRWATASIGLNRFGTTVHADAVSEYFKLTPEHIARRVSDYVADLGGRNALLEPWRAI
ncbi:Transketolase, thiamine diphosphate binding domain-containing protein [Xylariaceae sp. FL0594]|nr:Transketolase, thiamine diphosphate binding domain-containing protein [Xylariaceae sp. FL0594]